LRPEIQVETGVWPLRFPPIERPVISFVAGAFNRAPEVPSIPCVVLAETVAEKYVAPTRWAGAEIAEAGGPRDARLVRHIYDLHVIRAHYDPAEVAALTRTIMLADAKAYGHQFPAYRDNPIAEALQAVAGLRKDPDFAHATQRFGWTW
jgi:hypothetical protein